MKTKAKRKIKTKNGSKSQKLSKKVKKLMENGFGRETSKEGSRKDKIEKIYFDYFYHLGFFVWQTYSECFWFEL